MTEISNYEVYTSRMAKTVFDKCWWFDKIDDSIDTVVDFGCATGDLFTFLRRIAPERFNRFIGIEKDSEMRSRANNKHNCYRDTIFISSIEQLSSIPNFDASRAVIVMNSVIHEILSYQGESSFLNCLSNIKNFGFKYIAIRDMYFNNNKPFVSFDDSSIDNIKSKLDTLPKDNIYKERWKEYSNNMILSPQDIIEFLLKYSYFENWEREKSERYLWDWANEVAEIFKSTYSLDFCEQFSILYQKKKIKKDLGIDLPYNTHMKVLLTKKE